MKKRQLTILITIASVLLVSSIGLCVFLLTREDIAKAENKYTVDYNSFSTYECDDFMNIDGVLDEEQWQDKVWFYNTGYAMDDAISYEVTAFPTSKGAYVAFKVKDTNIVYNGLKNMSNNSNFHVRVAGYQDEVSTGTFHLDMESFQIDMQCISSVYTNCDRAVVVDGVPNSGDTKGAVLEFFCAWESLGVDTSEGVPTVVGVVPAYYAMLQGEETVTRFSATGVAGDYSSGHAFLFNEGGYLGTDTEGAVLGCAANGHTKTPGWDLSREQEGRVESLNPTDQEFLYFKDVYAKNVIVETTLIPKSGCTDHTSVPRAGIAFVASGGQYCSITPCTREELECSYDTGIFSNVHLLTSTPASGMVHTMQHASDYKNTTNQPGVKLTVIKYDEIYICFIDGNLMCVLPVQSCAGEVYPALFAASAGAVFQDYSCREITEEDMLKYLNANGVYQIETKLASGGGRVEATANYIEKGESVDVSIVTNAGYVLDSVKINDKEQLSSLKKTAVDGTFTLENIGKNYDVSVKFIKYTGTSNELTVSATSKENVAADLIVTSKSNGLLTYKSTIKTNEEAKIVLPAGTYDVKIIAENYVIYTTQVNLNKNRTVTAKLQTSAFAETVTVNGKTLKNNRAMYDFSEESAGRVSTSFEDGSKLKPLYFNQTAKDFVVTTTIDYTTNFREGVEYQPDLMGGFYLHDGEAYTWITAWRDGIRYRGLKKSSTGLRELTSVDCLLYPNPVSVEFTLVKMGTEVYVYINGTCVQEMKFTELGPDLDPNKELAIGLTMLADKTADIRFSNYSLKTGETAVKKFIETHKSVNASSKKLNVNPLFAEYNVLGAKTYQSAINNYNVFADKVTGSYAMGTKGKNLWLYSEQGSTTALVSAKIRYSSDFTKDVDYQPDLFGGFAVASESKSGWIMAFQTGIHMTGSLRDTNLVKDKVLFWNGKDTPKDVTLTLAMKDRYIYVYFDDVLVKRYMKAAIVEGADQNTKLIFGLRMNSDKPADIEYSNISYTEDAKTVADYISTH